MSITERLLRLIFPSQDITHAGDLYLRRWLLTPQFFGWRLMLHKIARPDRDRSMHDHPWDFATWCVRGGYVECVRRPGGTQIETLRAGQVRFRGAEHTHRIDRIVGPAAWTLVLHGPHRRTWGFWDTSVTPAKFTAAPAYFRDDYDKASPPRRHMT